MNLCICCPSPRFPEDKQILDMTLDTIGTVPGMPNIRNILFIKSQMVDIVFVTYRVCMRAQDENLPLFSMFFFAFRVYFMLFCIIVQKQ